MRKYKRIQLSLLKNSINAFWAAVELHNKPNIPYRYETVVVLLINAWELLLKAYIWKYMGKKKVILDETRTITIEKSLEIIYDSLDQSHRNYFRPIKENINIIIQYRNKIIHFYFEDLEPVIFSIIAKNVLDYSDFIEKHFGLNVVKDDEMLILPIGFRLPFNPIDFISRKYADENAPQEVKNFIQSITRITKELKDIGIEDSVVLGYDVYLSSIKKIQNSDIVVAVAQDGTTPIVINKIYNGPVQITDNASAPKVLISDEELLKQYPIVYSELVKICRDRYENFKLNNEFHNNLAEERRNIECAFERKLHPKSKSISMWLYSLKIINYLDTKYKFKVI